LKHPQNTVTDEHKSQCLAEHGMEAKDRKMSIFLDLTSP
jgi:hypothetical protein